MTPIKWAKYTRRFKRPFSFGNSVIADRNGFLLKEKFNNSWLYAEASPLIGHSRDSEQDVELWLNNCNSSPPPSIVWAKECLSIQKISNRALPNQVYSSYLISAGTLDQMLSQFEYAISQGFSTFKIKIISEKKLDYLEFFKRRKYSNILWRLDLNAAIGTDWIDFFKKLRQYIEIDFLEEPENWSAQWKNAGFSLAVDESAIGQSQEWKTVASNFICKPMVHGPKLPIEGFRFIYGSCLESDVGKRALIYWLSHYNLAPSTQPAGLGTSSLFADDFSIDLPVYSEKMVVSPLELDWLESLHWTSIK